MEHGVSRSAVDLSQAAQRALDGRSSIDRRFATQTTNANAAAYERQLQSWWSDHKAGDERLRQHYEAELAARQQQLDEKNQRLAELQAKQAAELVQIGEWDSARAQLWSTATRRAVVPFALAFVVTAYIGWRIAS